MGACGGQCCRFGALIDAREQARIAPLVPRIAPRLRPAARRVLRRNGWHFRQPVRERYVDANQPLSATRVADGLCVFVLDQEAGGCALHQLALEDNVPIEHYKPLECLLFPLNDVVRGVVHLHQWEGYPCTARSPNLQPAFRTLKRELSLILGDEGYEALESRMEELALCRGIGGKKVLTLNRAFNEPFFTDPVVRASAPAASPALANDDADEDIKENDDDQAE